MRLSFSPLRAVGRVFDALRARRPQRQVVQPPPTTVDPNAVRLIRAPADGTTVKLKPAGSAGVRVGNGPPSWWPTGPAIFRMQEIPIRWRPNAQALAAAERSEPGKRLMDRTRQYAQTYIQASQLTGVPAAIIAAIHCNESGQHMDAHGPESGFGLDPAHVSTREGNVILARYFRDPAQRTWDRGGSSSRSVLQSAVIAAAVFKELAADAGITVDGDMTANQVAGAITAYVAGPDAGRRAAARGESFMFDTGDANPHPNHPGGTVATRRGRIRVRGGRKPGLLRWDVLLPLLNRQLAPARRSATLAV